jgi:hypothetical protein
VLEVDGAHHLSVGQWSRDMRRERSLVLRVGKVLRLRGPVRAGSSRRRPCCRWCSPTCQ